MKEGGGGEEKKDCDKKIKIMASKAIAHMVLKGRMT
jgi:hypothetical protein